MQRTTSRVLALLSALVLHGCYGGHGSEVDAGRSVDAGAASVDAPMEPPIDAGHALPDAAALECPLARPDATCLESFLVQPGRAFSLPFAFDGCGCCVETECAVAVDAPSKTLSLTTTLCPDPCDCDGCVTPTGACDVPALEQGDWRVVVNGAPAFELPVFEDSGLVPPPAACATYAEPPSCGGDPWALDAWAPDAFCVAPRASLGGQFDVLRAKHECFPCPASLGTCSAELNPRYTDDLPEGGDITLYLTSYAGTCELACPAVCLEVERDCAVPALTFGHYYRVFAGGELRASFVAGAATMDCMP